MAKGFSDHYFHIGGDEVNGKEWDANPKIQAFMKAHGIKNNEALQAFFSGRVQKLVTKHGKAVVGWDEVLVEGVPKDIVIQSWRGQASLAQAAKQGYRGILSNGYYLDLGWSAARHYAVDPMSGDAANLSAEERRRILGGESCMWAEYVSPENVDSRIWPRNAATPPPCTRGWILSAPGWSGWVLRTAPFRGTCCNASQVQHRRRNLPHCALLAMSSSP